MTGGRKVIIVGAGIAGLAAALRLRAAGWQPIVIERAPALRPEGYSLTLSGIGYDAAERMGLLPILRARQITPDEMVYIRPDGSTRFSVPGATVRAMLGDRALNLMRGDIEDVLHRSVRDTVDIRFGASVVEIEQDEHGVRVVLSDGTTEQADLLVGADGLHSATRELVFGPESDFRVDLNHMAGVFLLDELPRGARKGTTSTLTVAGRTLAIINLGDRGSAAFFAYRTDDPAAELMAGPLVALPRAYNDIKWVAPQVLGQLSNAESVYFDTVSQVVVDRWRRGRVVLLGDAAWCVTLFAGFGASLAIGGAERLGAALEAHPDKIALALGEWDRDLRPEAEAKQKLGRQVKGLYAPADPIRLWLRDLPLRLAALRPASWYLQRRLQLKG